MLRWTWLAMAIGCSFEHGVAGSEMSPGTDGGTRDSTSASVDAMTILPPDAQTCWSIAGVGVDFCLPSPPNGTISVGSNQSVNTGSTGNSMLQCKQLVAGSSDVCVVAASSITIDATRTLSATGPRPLVLLASTITVNGTIDVSSRINGQTGPNANASGCDGGTSPNSGGGGQGGSFGGKGGDGGNKDGQNNSRGRAGETIDASTLRGGCRGGNGGDGAVGGDGGGAVLLIADELSFASTGRINASGASGRGASQGRRGGAGAGSGGMIALAAATIAVDPATQIFANGGHGGGGSSNNSAGQSGTDPTGPTSGGGGGNGSGEAGNGGDGFPVAQRNGESGDENGDGGGGGGGGAGVIRVISGSSIAAAQVSPPPS